MSEEGHEWTLVDVVAADDGVTAADLGSLPYRDREFEAIVLSRALWATDRDDVLREL